MKMIRIKQQCVVPLYLSPEGDLVICASGEDILTYWHATTSGISNRGQVDGSVAWFPGRRRLIIERGSQYILVDTNPAVRASVILQLPAGASVPNDTLLIARAHIDDNGSHAFVLFLYQEGTLPGFVAMFDAKTGHSIRKWTLPAMKFNPTPSLVVFDQVSGLLLLTVADRLVLLKRRSHKYWPIVASRRLSMRPVAIAYSRPKKSIAVLKQDGNGIVLDSNKLATRATFLIGNVNILSSEEIDFCYAYKGAILVAKEPGYRPILVPVR